MKKFLLWLFILLLILLLIWLIWWFLHRKQEPPPSWQTYIQLKTEYVPSDTTQQIIVWRNPGGGDDFLNYWLDSIHNAAKKKSSTDADFHITVFCGNCADSNLLLIEGPGIKTFIQSSGGGKGGGTTCTSPPSLNCNGPHGGGDTIWWCVNFPVEVKDSANFDNIDTQIVKYPTTGRNPRPVVNNTASGVHDTITVAVFDTGIDTVEAKTNGYFYTNTSENCLDPNAGNGWNFPYKNAVVADDYTHVSKVGHGQVVAHLINEQVKFYGQNNVKILPVKIHDSLGVSDLFSVLCGMAYAKERGAQIINASFGYYALKKPGVSAIDDPSAQLIKQYIKHYLIDTTDSKKSILLIAAAGNGDTKTHDSVERALYINAGLTPPTNMRDLDQVNFYPASLAADPELPNVIAVTTVFGNQVSKNENFSGNVVDIGVNADLPLADDYWFANTRIPHSFVRGTSYATPIVTGIICAHYNMINSSIPDKSAILNTLLSDPFIGNTDNANGKLRKGTMFERVH